MNFLLFLVVTWLWNCKMALKSWILNSHYFVLLFFWPGVQLRRHALYGKFKAKLKTIFLQFFDFEPFFVMNQPEKTFIVCRKFWQMYLWTQFNSQGNFSKYKNQIASYENGIDTLSIRFVHISMTRL